MRVYTCNDFQGHWPVGSDAVVIANDEDDAKTILDAKLRSIGLEQDIDKSTIKEVDLRWAQAIVLCDGDY